MATETNRAIDTSSWIGSVTYLSEAAEPPAPAELDALLCTARARNHSAGVTGMLIYDNGRFLQTLEGPPGALEPIWSSIRRDPRHRSIEVLSQHLVPVRLFSDWDMQLFARREDRQRRLGPSGNGLDKLTARIAEAARYALAGDGEGLNALVASLVTDGWLSETLIKHLLEPVARRLGDAFIADDCSEIDLTIGLGLLQIAGHAVHNHPSAQGPVVPGPYCIVVAPAPGEPHMLGPSLLSELFINAGWKVEIAFPKTAAALAKLLIAHRPDVVDIALSDAMPRHAALALMRETINSCRSAQLQHPVVFSVGGRTFAELAATAQSIGADYARHSAAGAPAILTQMVRDRRGS